MLKFLKQYFPIRNAIFVLLEGVVIFSTFLISSILLTVSTSYYFDILLLLRIIFVTLICLISLYYNNLYNFDEVKRLPEISVRLLQALGVSSITLAGIYYCFPLTFIDANVFIISIGLLIFFITGWRLIYLQALRKGLFNESIILIGTSSLALDIYETIKKTIDCGYQIVAVFPDLDKNFTNIFGKGVTFHENIDLLHKTAKKKKIKKIVVALKEQRGNFPMEQLMQCKRDGLEIIDGCSFYEQLSGKILVEKIHPSWLVFSDGFKKSATRRFLKRSVDIFGSLFLLLLLWPVIAIVAIVVKLDSKGPVFFFQKRVGKRKKEFTLYKFRSMEKDAEKKTGPVYAQEADMRVTRSGNILRKYRLDELPQLVNILKGEMSLVGPRPERLHFTEKLEKKVPFYSERFSVKPGLTGWAQISFPYGASEEDAIEKLNYELFYIKNMSTTMDIIILLRTFKTVILGNGAR